MSSPCETENLFFELQYLLHLLQCWGTDDGSLSWHTVLSMYEYSFTFNQEDQLLGWNLSTCKWFLPKWYALSVHILIDTSYYHNFLGWFAKICEKLNEWFLDLDIPISRLSITNYSQYSWNEISLVEALFLLSYFQK